MRDAAARLTVWVPKRLRGRFGFDLDSCGGGDGLIIVRRRRRRTSRRRKPIIAPKHAHATILFSLSFLWHRGYVYLVNTSPLLSQSFVSLPCPGNRRRFVGPASHPSTDRRHFSTLHTHPSTRPAHTALTHSLTQSIAQSSSASRISRSLLLNHPNFSISIRMGARAAMSRGKRTPMEEDLSAHMPPRHANWRAVKAAET